jgi:hypothetical protein
LFYEFEDDSHFIVSVFLFLKIRKQLNKNDFIKTTCFISMICSTTLTCRFLLRRSGERTYYLQFHWEARTLASSGGRVNVGIHVRAAFATDLLGAKVR